MVPIFKEQMWGWEASCSGSLDFSMDSDSLSSTIPAVARLRPILISGGQVSSLPQNFVLRQPLTTRHEKSDFLRNASTPHICSLKHEHNLCSSNFRRGSVVLRIAGSGGVPIASWLARKVPKWHENYEIIFMPFRGSSTPHIIFPTEKLCGCRDRN